MIRVLMVDDEADILDLVQIAFEDAPDISARLVGSGAEAQGVLQDEEFDIFVLDWMMPPPDGHALLTMIRARPELATRPVLICTAKTGDAARLDLQHLGATDVIEKPFSPLALPDLLRDVYQRSGASEGKD